MNLRLLSNPKFLIGVVVLLAALFVASRTTTPLFSPSLQSAWLERLRQSRSLALDEIQPGGATGCAVAVDQRQLLLPGGETCTFTITAAASALLPATRVLSMTLVSGEIAAPLVVEMRFDAQPLTVEESLVISQPVEFELPEGGAVLTLPGCTVTDETLGQCVVRIGGE